MQFWGGYRERIIEFLATRRYDVYFFCKYCQITEEEFGKIMGDSTQLPLDVLKKVANCIGMQKNEIPNKEYIKK